MKFLIEKIKNKPIDSNCYVIYNNLISDCLIVDPGTEDCEELLVFLEQNKLDPTYILLTHEHFDHIWGVNKLLDLFTCKVVCSEKCLECIADKKKNLSVFYNQTGFEILPTNAHIVSNGKLEFGSYNFQFKETLGHSLGSVSFWVNDMFFGGDVLIKDTKTVTKLPGGSKKKLINTLNELNELFSQRDMVVYPGHGDTFRFNEIDFSKII